MRDLNLGQRVVAIVALAAGLRFLGSYIVARYVLDGSEWFGYVPLTSATSTTAPSFGVVAVWLLMVALWAGASIWLLGLPYTESQHDDPGSS